MEQTLPLSESYPWFEDVLALPIDEAGMYFFRSLGYTEDDQEPLIPRCEMRSFVYSLLPNGRILIDTDRMHMSSVIEASYLFRLNQEDFPIESEDVAFLAIDMEDVGYARSDEAYEIHYLVSKCIDHRSAVLFRHRSAIMLSFVYPLEDDRLAIYLSDWFDACTPNQGQFERIHVASTSLDSAIACYDGLAYEAIRDYYKNPITYMSAWYSYVLGPLDVSWRLDPYFYSKEELLDAIEGVMETPLNDYGDDYVEDKVRQTDDDAEDFNLDDLEWELQNAADEEEVETDDEILEESPAYSIAVENIPSEAFDNPIHLLDWIESHSETEVSYSSDLHHNEIADRPKNIVHWTAEMSNSPVSIGSHVIHRELGEGVVVRSSLNDLSVEFEHTRRQFAFPRTFERGILTLLG